MGKACNCAIIYVGRRAKRESKIFKKQEIVGVLEK